MEQLAKATLTRLRDQLRERGQRPSVKLPAAGLPPAALELLSVSTEYGPLCEAMYQMMAADGQVSGVEREVLKGAMRTLTDDGVRSVHIEAMLDSSAKRLAAEGREARLEAIIDAIKDDPIKSEVTIVLAAAVALADDVLAPEEDAVFQQLARGLNIDEQKANNLLAELRDEVLSLKGEDLSNRG